MAVSQRSERSRRRCAHERPRHRSDAEGVKLEGRRISFRPNWWFGPRALKARTCSANLDGLEATATNTLVVKPTLQTTRDDNIFALGDCAYLVLPGETAPLPPRAQTAHQESSHLVKQLQRRLLARRTCSRSSIPRFRLAGFAWPLHDRWQPDGLRVRQVDADRGLVCEADVPLALQDARNGAAWAGKVALDTVSRLLTRRTEPHVKLH